MVTAVAAANCISIRGSIIRLTRVIPATCVATTTDNRAANAGPSTTERDQCGVTAVAATAEAVVNRRVILALAPTPTLESSERLQDLRGPSSIAARADKSTVAVTPLSNRHSRWVATHAAKRPVVATSDVACVAKLSAAAKVVAHTKTK